MEGWPQAGVVLFFYSLHTPLLPSYRRRPVSIAFVFLWLWWNTVDPDLRRGDGGFVFLSRLRGNDGVGGESSPLWRGGRRPGWSYFFIPCTPRFYRHTGVGRYPLRSYFFGFGGIQWTPTCVGVTVVLYFCPAYRRHVLSSLRRQG